MNCKPGDLAVIVSDTFQENIGKFVKVLGPGDVGDWECDALGARLIFEWFDDDGPTGEYGCTSPVQPTSTWNDDELRPIRDSDGQDETLRIAGLPAPLAEREHAGG